MVHLSLCFNPSHLERNPVVLGRTRAKQDGQEIVSERADSLC